MNVPSLLAYLDHQDAKRNRWLFTVNDFKSAFPETESALMAALRRQVRNTLIVKVYRGLYANARARCKPNAELECVAQALRDDYFSYISFSSALAIQGVIEGHPGRLNVMTEGRSKKYKTLYGDINFIHSKKNMSTIKDQLVFNDDIGMYVATIDRAISDMKKVGMGHPKSLKDRSSL